MIDLRELIYQELATKWHIREKIKLDDEVLEDLLAIICRASSVELDEEGALLIAVDEEEDEQNTI